MNRVKILILTVALLLPALADADRFQQAPILDKLVASGELPALEHRLPESPRVMLLNEHGKQPGHHGGELRLLMAKSKDIRMMTVYGYARLIGLTPELKTIPDIVLDFEVHENREFTFHLRPGHRWSDGTPFTSDAFRYFWEDIANNEELYPSGPPKKLRVDGELPEVEFPDQTTVRYRWSKPNPLFLTALTEASPLMIYAAGHYLKQFHADYADSEKLKQLVEESGARNWAGLHHRQNRTYKQTNPDLPSLQPWVNSTYPPAERFVFQRNPYFHRVDGAGKQLPYIDTVVIDIASSSLVPVKTGAGDSDLQARYLRVDDFTFLKAGEERNGYSVKLWKTVSGSRVALYPNLNSNDAIWRELVRDRRFRRALSMGVDRQEVNQVVYFGLALESNNTVLPQCRLFKPNYQTDWANYSLQEANRLLDEIGLVEKNDRGIRLRPDGQPLEIIIHTAGESTEETDVLELVHDSWLKLGIKIFTKPSQREVFRNRVFSGDAMMSVWSGIENGIPTESMSPWEFVPTSQQQLQWPKWGQHYETSGQAGSEPDMDSTKELLALFKTWQNAATDTQKSESWERILEIHAEEVFSIGLICGVLQPVVVSNELRNVPDKGVYSWSPTSYFGVYNPDTFWFTGKRRGQTTTAAN